MPSSKNFSIIKRENGVLEGREGDVIMTIQKGIFIAATAGPLRFKNDENIGKDRDCSLKTAAC